MQTMDSGLCGHKISRTLMEAFLQSWCDRGWPHARVFDFGILPGTGSIRAASVKSTGQGGGVSAAIWVNRRIHGRIQTRNSDLSLYRASSIEHRAWSIFCWFNLSHPAAIKSALWLWILCAISSANVVQKRVKSEFRGIRPLTTNNLLRVHHCLLLVPGTWYLVPGTAAAAAAAAGLADRGRTVLPTGTQPVFGYQVPGTR